MKIFYKTVALFISAMMIVACTSTFNWREVRNDELYFLALFPSKTNSEQHNVQYQNIDLTMTMQAAMAGDSLFAVGTMPFDQKTVNSQSILDWMKINTAKLIQSQQPPQAIQFEVKTASTPQQYITAQGFNLKGLGPDGNYRIYWVRWMVRTDDQGSSRIYQLSALKSFKALPNEAEQKSVIEQFETFMSGFRPY